MLRSTKFKTLSCALLLCASVLSAQVNTSISSASAAAGQSVNLNIAVNSAGNAPAALQWTMSFSPADIAGISITAGSAASAAGKTVSCASNSPGTATCIAYGMNQTTIANGAVAVATLQLASSPADTSVPVQISGLSAAAPDGSAIPDTGSGGVITVGSIAPQVGLVCLSTALHVPGTETCWVSLSKAAPAGGFTVNLKASNTFMIAPSSVVIPAGTVKLGFPISGTMVPVSTPTTLTASGGSNSPSVTVWLVPPIHIVNLYCLPTSVPASGTASCKATLNGSAPAGGFPLQITSNNPALAVPANIVVPAGGYQASFTAVASPVSNQQTAVVTATGGNTSNAVSLTLNPGKVPGTL